MRFVRLPVHKVAEVYILVNFYKNKNNISTVTRNYKWATDALEAIGIQYNTIIDEMYKDLKI